MTVPTIIVEVAFPEGASTSSLLHLDDPSRGKLNTGTLGALAVDDVAWTDITPYVRSGGIQRGSTRVDTPIVQYESGTCSVVLRNEDRRFDPSNLAGPYVTHSGQFYLDGSALNTNTNFETGTTTGWTATGGTFTAATDQKYAGTYSGKLVPDGVTAIVHMDSAQVAVVAGDTYRAAAYVRPANAQFVNLNVNWYTAGSVFISTSSAGALLPAASWSYQSADFTAPATAAFAKVITSQSGTPPAGNIVWSDNVTLTHLSDLITEITAMRAFRIRAVWNSVTYELFRGYVDQWQIGWDPSVPEYSEAVVTASDGFKVLNGIDRPAVGPFGAGETTGARVNRVLDGISWPATDRDVATGDSTVQETTLEGPALSELQVTSDSELGELYMDAGGRVVFRNRNAFLTDTRSNTSQMTLGDGGGSELPYQQLSIATDDATFYNIIRVTRAGGTEQLVQDGASQALYYPKTFKPADDPILETDNDALNYANWLLYVSKDPELRFVEIVIDPRYSDTLLYPHVLGRLLGDRITVIHRPPGGGTINKDQFIRGIQHSFAPTEWMTTWTMQSADRYGSFLTLDHPTLGVLDSNAIAY